MNKGSIKITTIILVMVTFFLAGSTIYIGKLITTEENGTSNIAPQKTKAANITYSKLITLNTVSDQQVVTDELPVDSMEITPTISETEISEAPTPTEIILAEYNSANTEEVSSEAEILTPTANAQVDSLPDAGFISNGLIIFGAATLLVFFSFIF